MERRHRRLIGRAAAAAAAAAWLGSAAWAENRPDGDPPGGGSQRLSVEAARRTHLQFSGDACLVAVDAVVARAAAGPKRPLEDSFSFVFRSPSLFRMRYEERVCLPEAPVSSGPCRGEWEDFQGKDSGAVRCLPGRPADTAEALVVAERKGLPPAPVDGRRLSLRAVVKGHPLAKHPKLRGKTVWIVESREQCLALDAQSLALLLKLPCAKLGWRSGSP